MDGWFKIHRKILDWEWWDKPEMVKLLILFVCKANVEDREWHGISIFRGQFVTSFESLKTESGYSIQKIRTCIKRFEKTKEITIKSTSKYSIITICNYDDYQVFDNTNQQADQQTNNKQTTNEQQQYKKERIYKKENSTNVEEKKVELSFANTKKTIEERSKNFYQSLVPFVSIYSKEMVRAFFDYWTEPNRSKTKMKFELERTWDVKRRLNTWSSRDKTKNIQSNGTEYKQQQQQQRAREIEELNEKLNESGF